MQRHYIEYQKLSYYKVLRQPGAFTVRNFFAFLILALCLIIRVQAADSGVITIYHHVAIDTPPSTSISPADFRKQLDYLRDNNFNVIALDVMLDAITSGSELPEKAVAITFDDGYISIHDTAFPMLKEYGFPFTLFLSTGPINSNLRGYMNWDQVKEMSDAGVIIANHLVEHPYMLTRLQGESDPDWIERLRLELMQAESDILAHTGQSHKYLAYPFGEYDKAIKEMVAAMGYLGLSQNSGAVNKSTDLLAITRFPLTSIYSDLKTAATKLESLAFNVSKLSPDTPVTNDHSPNVTLQFAPGKYNLDQINCFANSEAIPMQWLDREKGIVELVPTKTYNGRRWNYLCTAPLTGSNRYYWYSVLWIDPTV